MSKARPRRGRPAQLSREQILSCALDLLKSGPDKVTIQGVSRALGCAPMSLYTHIKSRDDMLHGVAELVLGKLEVNLQDGSSWQVNIRNWLYQVHAHLAAHPQVLRLVNDVARLNSQNSNLLIPWLRIHAELLRNLQKAGFNGEQLLQLSRWLAQIVISDVMLNPPVQIVDRSDAFKTARITLDTKDKETFLLVSNLVGKSKKSLFDFVVDQALMHLEHLAKDSRDN